MFFSQSDFESSMIDFSKYFNNTEAIHTFLYENQFIAQFPEYSVTTQKKYEYLIAVVRLYGLLEKFIEDIICEYLDKLSRLCKLYNELPKEIINNHVLLSAELIKRLDYQKYANLLTNEQIISTLYSCTHENKSKLVNLSFVQHNANFRIDEIVQIFNKIGIKDFVNKHKNSYHFKNYYMIRHNLQEDEYANESKENLYEKLNFLIAKRNEVAHGDINDILGKDAINELLDYIKYFVFSVSEIVFKEYLSHWILHNEFYKITPLKIYNNAIICFNIVNETISLKDLIIIINSQGVYYSEILEIQHNKITFSELSADKNEISVGVKISMKVKNNCSFWLFHNFD